MMMHLAIETLPQQIFLMTLWIHTIRRNTDSQYFWNSPMDIIVSSAKQDWFLKLPLPNSDFVCGCTNMLSKFHVSFCSTICKHQSLTAFCTLHMQLNLLPLGQKDKSFKSLFQESGKTWGVSPTRILSSVALCIDIYGK